MSTVVEKVRRLVMSKEDRLLRAWNIVDACGNLTSTGTTVLLDHLFEANKSEMVKIVQALSDEKKKESK